MKRAKILLGLAGIFLAGVITGGLITGGVVKRRAAHMIRTVSQGDLSPIAEMTFKRMQRKLKLRDDQNQKVQEIISDFFSQVASLRQQQKPEVQRVLRKSLQKMKPVLDEEQFTTLKKMLKKRDKVPAGKEA